MPRSTFKLTQEKRAASIRNSRHIVPPDLPRRTPIRLRRVASVDKARRPRTKRSQPVGPPGRDGLDGVPGLDGAPGLDGVPGADGRNGRDGQDGRDGKDGKDGLPGEQGPPGPVGPAGEPGKRGKAGPPGKQGPPGPPGVCAYYANYNCDSLKDSPLMLESHKDGNQLIGALLMAPTIVGYDSSASMSAEANENERQVTVNEGDNIQLSCEASGQPKPSYIWRRTEQDRGSAATILYDVGANLRLNSYPGGQLPLSRVDRLQAGNYECVASNGVLPNAIKRLALDVNYAPTVHIYPAPSVRRIRLGSSVLMECIVDANPPALSYWTFGADLMMSVPGEKTEANLPIFGWRANDTRAPSSGATTATAAAAAAAKLGDLNKYTITESAGQLRTGAYYTILTLNISRVARDDLGLYKCVSKNLIAQSSGYFILEDDIEPGQVDGGVTKGLVQGTIERRLDSNFGWPDHMIEREHSYVTFGIEHRKLHLNALSRVGQADMILDTLAQQHTMKSSFSHQATPSTHDKTPTSVVDDIKSQDAGASAIDQVGRRKHQLDGRKVLLDDQIENFLFNDLAKQHANGTDKSATHIRPDNTTGRDILNNVDLGASAPSISTPDVGRDTNDYNSADGNDDLDELDLCQIETIPELAAEVTSGATGDVSRSNVPRIERSKIKLLDQVGKPVYVGNSHNRGLPLDWWSLDSESNDKPQAPVHDDRNPQQRTHYFATSLNYTNLLLEYGNLNDLLKDQRIPNKILHSSSSNRGELNHHSDIWNESGRRAHGLRYPLHGSSRVIFGGLFFYVSQTNSSESSLSGLELIAYNISSIESTNSSGYRSINLNSKLSQHFKDQPLLLDPEYQLNRVELTSDENGVWVIVPTIEKRSTLSKQNIMNYVQLKTALVRRLHVMKLKPIRESDTSIDINYHVNMKLDWRMIGQMFVIDGVLYGIKDRHTYSSKLQFAYDLYKCKLLSTDYLNEPHRTFTNHFGNTQMIKYNPNDPKRLYTIDSGNLLWCPVKLIDMNPDDI